MDVLPSEVHNALMNFIAARNSETVAHSRLKSEEQKYNRATEHRKQMEQELCKQLRSERMRGTTRVARHGILYSVSNGGFGLDHDRISVEPVNMIE